MRSRRLDIVVGTSERRRPAVSLASGLFLSATDEMKLGFVDIVAGGWERALGYVRELAATIASERSAFCAVVLTKLLGSSVPLRDLPSLQCRTQVSVVVTRSVLSVECKWGSVIEAQAISCLKDFADRAGMGLRLHGVMPKGSDQL